MERSSKKATSVDNPGIYGTVTCMKFVCQLTEKNGGWTGEYLGAEIGPVRVTAPSRVEALRKLEGEIRYWLELCPCTGEAYREVEIEPVEASAVRGVR